MTNLSRNRTVSQAMREFARVLVGRLLQEEVITPADAVSIAESLAGCDGTGLSVAKVLDSWARALDSGKNG